MLEIKNGNCKLTDKEEKWHREWRGQVHVVRSPEGSVAYVNAKVEAHRLRCELAIRARDELRFQYLTDKLTKEPK